MLHSQSATMVVVTVAVKIATKQNLRMAKGLAHPYSVPRATALLNYVWSTSVLSQTLRSTDPSSSPSSNPLVSVSDSKVFP